MAAKNEAMEIKEPSNLTESDYRLRYEIILKDLDELYNIMRTLKKKQSHAFYYCNKQLLRVDAVYKNYRRIVAERYPTLLLEEYAGKENYLQKYFKCRSFLSTRKMNAYGCDSEDSDDYSTDHGN